MWYYFYFYDSSGTCIIYYIPYSVVKRINTSINMTGVHPSPSNIYIYNTINTTRKYVYIIRVCMIVLLVLLLLLLLCIKN